MPKVKLFDWLILILILGFLIRIYSLNSLPYGTHPDEASWGYNAYSILKTSRDEHGENMPLIFKAFGDQKLPIFTYAVVPFVKIFGLSNLAVRLPSVIIGTLTILATYWLLRLLKFSSPLSLVGALITAISPWTIFLSRIFSFDSTFGLFFFLIAIALAIKGTQSKKASFYYLAAILFGLTWYSYIAYRLASTLTLFLFIFIFLTKKYLPTPNGWKTLLVFFATLLPLIFVAFTGRGNSRFTQVISTPFLGMVLEINENRAYCSTALPNVICQLSDNKIDAYLRSLIYRYVSLFSPNYLFLNGEPDYPFLNVAHYGLFPIVLLPFYLIGMTYYLIKLYKKRAERLDLLILGGLILTPLAALLVNEPQKVRLSALFPFLLIVLMTGIERTAIYFKKTRFKPYFLTFMTILLLIWVVQFSIDFFVIHLKKNSFHYNDHVNRLMQFLANPQVKNKEIYINGIDEAIVYYAFVNQVDPTYYQKNVKRENVDEIGFSHATDLGNIHVVARSYSEIACEIIKQKRPALYVSNTDLLAENVTAPPIKVITSANNVTKYLFIYPLESKYCRRN